MGSDLSVHDHCLSFYFACSLTSIVGKSNFSEQLRKLFITLLKNMTCPRYYAAVGMPSC